MYIYIYIYYIKYDKICIVFNIHICYHSYILDKSINSNLLP